MKILTKLFSKRDIEAIEHPELKLDVLLQSLDQYIDAYENKNGLKPERILVKSEIHKLFSEAGVYSARRFGEIIIIPEKTIKGELNWKVI